MWEAGERKPAPYPIREARMPGWPHPRVPIALAATAARQPRGRAAFVAALFKGIRGVVAFLFIAGTGTAARLCSQGMALTWPPFAPSGWPQHSREEG